VEVAVAAPGRTHPRAEAAHAYYRRYHADVAGSVAPRLRLAPRGAEEERASLGSFDLGGREVEARRRGGARLATPVEKRAAPRRRGPGRAVDGRVVGRDDDLKFLYR
jgi:hypothetical protein